MTPQREAILETLRASRLHPSAEDILLEVQNRVPTIALGTVYRNLQVLVDEGLALRLPALRGSHRFDGDVSDHHHVVCEECGCVADVHLESPPAVLEEAARLTGYEILAGNIYFHGRCPNCRGNHVESRT